MIRVIYTNKACAMIEEKLLDGLIARGEIAAFCRSSGWVNIRRDPLRGKGGFYDGPERRGKPHSQPDWFSSDECCFACIEEGPEMRIKSPMRRKDKREVLDLGYPVDGIE